jgi:hypothetical protein
MLTRDKEIQVPCLEEAEHLGLGELRRRFATNIFHPLPCHLDLRCIVNERGLGSCWKICRKLRQHQTVMRLQVVFGIYLA